MKPRGQGDQPDPAHEVDAPFGRTGRIAQRRPGNGDFRRPAAGRDPRADIPGSVPVDVDLAAIGHPHVALRAGGVDLKGLGGAPIEVGIEGDAENVVREIVEVAPQVLHPDAGLASVVAADDADIEVFVVEEHPHFGRLGGGREGVRVDLEEGPGGRGLLPVRFFEAAVDFDRRGGGLGRKTEGLGPGLEVARAHRGGYEAKRCHSEEAPVSKRSGHVDSLVARDRAEGIYIIDF